MPSDILRERPDTPPDAPRFADLASAVPDDLGAQITKRRAEIAATEAERASAAKAEEHALETKAERMKPVLEQTTKVVGAPIPEPPAPLSLPEPPSRGLRAFLMPTATQSPETSISQFLQGVQLLATGFTGLRKGDARPALASMAGALKGWQEGDKENADRHFADWKAATDKLIAEHQSRHNTWKELMENRDLTVQQQLKLLELSGIQEGYAPAIEAAKKGNVEDVLKFQQHDLDQLGKLEQHRDAIAAAKDAKDTTNEIRRMGIIAQNERDQARRDDQKAARENAAANKEQAKADRQEAADEKPAHGEFYDWKLGRTRQITMGEWRENARREAAGQEPLFTPQTNQQVALVERLAIAPKILDRVRQLIDKVNAVAPGENITAGMLNRLKQKAGISAELQELRSLNADAALELTAALSGGQPRITILHIIREEATPGVGMTRDAAQRSVDTMETTVRNRLQMTTGDPASYDKLSKGLKSYGQKEALPEGWSIKLKKASDGG